MSDSVGTTFRGKRRYHSLLGTRAFPTRRILSSLSLDREKIIGKFLATGGKAVWPTACKKIYQVSYIYREITRGEFTATYITIVFESCQY